MTDSPPSTIEDLERKRTAFEAELAANKSVAAELALAVSLDEAAPDALRQLEECQRVIAANEATIARLDATIAAVRSARARLAAEARTVAELAERQAAYGAVVVWSQSFLVHTSEFEQTVARLVQLATDQREFQDEMIRAIVPLIRDERAREAVVRQIHGLTPDAATMLTRMLITVVDGYGPFHTQLAGSAEHTRARVEQLRARAMSTLGLDADAPAE